MPSPNASIRIHIPTVTQQYQARLPLYQHLEEEALYIVEGAMRRSNIKYHSITSRLKKLASFLDKAHRKELKNPLEEIHDVVGLRVVCLLLSDVEKIAALIRESFVIVREDNKVEGTEISSFGYMSVHFIAKMKGEYVGPRYDPIANIPFEIQARTIAMDAWANVSHYLEYKSEEDVPSDLRRDFYALSGLFYVADRHFEMFYESKRRSQQKMALVFEDALWDERTQQEINLDSLSAYLHAKFPGRKHADPARVSQLVSELTSTGYRNIGEVDEIVETAAEALHRYEEENQIIPDGVFTDMGVVRVSAAIMNEDYVRNSTIFSEAEGPWSESEKEARLQEEIKRYSRYRLMLTSKVKKP